MMKRFLLASATMCALSLAAGPPALAAAGSLPGSTAADESSQSPASRWRPLEAGVEPDVNPLKGFVPFAGDFDTFPHSLEWAYFPLDSVMTGPGTFDWTALETALDEIASRGHQTAMRFYLDYPGRDSGIPQFLLDGGLTTYAYDDYGNAGVSVMPDYDDPALRTALNQFVDALGARYDGDPRIGYLQAGLVGFWGEWHTYPYNGDAQPEDRMPSQATQLELITRFDAAFDETELQVRYPNALNKDLDLGYHDDSFAYSTKRSAFGWYFMDLMDQEGTSEKWRTNSIGGEVRPELQRCLFSADGCPDRGDGADNDFAGSLEQTHATWLINHAAFADGGYPAADRERAIAAARSMGYSFRVSQALLPAVTPRSTATVGITVHNEGVAPFYEDWPTAVALLDAEGSIVRSTTMDWRLEEVPVGGSRSFTGELDLSGLAPGRYTVAIQPVNPLTGGIPLRFANATQDADLDGWLTIGTTRIRPGTTASTHHQ